MILSGRTYIKPSESPVKVSSPWYAQLENLLRTNTQTDTQTRMRI